MEYNQDEGKLYVVFTVVDYPASHFTKDELDAIGNRTAANFVENQR